jgi:hypothetical protein
MNTYKCNLIFVVFPYLSVFFCFSGPHTKSDFSGIYSSQNGTDQLTSAEHIQMAAISWSFEM